MKPISLALLLALAALFARAQSPYLVADLNTYQPARQSSSSPYGFVPFHGRVYFGAFTQATGAELWATDGTTTTLVADIAGGAASSIPYGFTEVNGKLVFNARPTATGDELYVTDGTAAGTKLLADINPGSRSSSPGARIVYRNQLLFAADDGLDGVELWSTDGTPTGTHLLKDLVPGANGSSPNSFVLFRDAVYFLAAGGLWKTDGTADGTVAIVPPSPSTPFVALAAAGQNLFLARYNGTTTTPWVSDGTAAGTRQITDAATLATNTIVPFGDRALFVGNDKQHGSELWITDGTAAGTQLVSDIAPGTDSGLSGLPYIAVIGDTAFFAATSPTWGTELWRTDGTAAGTRMVRDINPGRNGSAPLELTAAGDKLVFIAQSGALRSLWVSDGTESGTRQVRTSAPPLTVGVTTPSVALRIPLLSVIDGIVYFSGSIPANGFEPWRSDGTDAGTVTLGNLAADPAPSSSPHSFIAAGDWLYFDAWDGIADPSGAGDPPPALFRSDGTASGSLKLTDGYASSAFPAGHTLLFLKDLSGQWITRGTPESTSYATEVLKRFPNGAVLAGVFQGQVFANVSGDLWAAPLEASTPAIRLATASGAGRLTDFAGRAMFLGAGLWTTDGTPGGTYAVAPSVNGYALETAVAGGLFYAVLHGTNDVKLWKSDGTTGGTAVIAAAPQNPANLTPAGTRLFFTAPLQNNANQLWVTDGTDAGTRALAPHPTASLLAATGDRVVFGVSDPTNGVVTLWVSDGTDAGTHVLRSDVHPYQFIVAGPQMASAGGLVYFDAADELQHGYEPWVTDGTAAGTRMVADLEPGSDSSFPANFTRAGERVFFSAATKATGSELWALPLGPRLSVGDVRVAEGDAGTATARFTVSLSAAAAQAVTVDYATADGTATAGTDYDAASGTLTFAPGETSKSVAVTVHGDIAAEGNESFFLTLRNAASAGVEKATAFALIEDDDARADLGLSLDFSLMWDGTVRVTAANAGPNTATNATLRITSTPADTSGTCSTCVIAIPQLDPGATAKPFDYRWFSEQQYVTASVTAREIDPQPSNNTVAWTIGHFMAMDAMTLTPGAQANVWIGSLITNATVSVESSNPAVVSVPATITGKDSRNPISFVVHALAVGTSTIRVVSPTGTFGTLDVIVVAPGTKLRWPDAVTFFPRSNLVRFDQALTLDVFTTATAPYTGESATGPLIISANGRELARVTLANGTHSQQVPIYLPDVGALTITASYAGDANFLPVTVTAPVTVTPGTPTILGVPERSGTSATVHVFVTGSPMAAPTGTITLSEAGVVSPVKVTLSPSSTPGTAQADIALTNLGTGVHTFTLTYSGDRLYGAGTQSVRMPEARKRAAGR